MPESVSEVTFRVLAPHNLLRFFIMTRQIIFDQPVFWSVISAFW